MTKPEPGDAYLHDGIHYHLSVELKMLVTESIDGHIASGGRWWWKGEVPESVTIDPFYREREGAADG